MKVKELIEKLLEMDQEASVEIYAGYDYEYGAQYKADVDVVQENSLIAGRWEKIVYVE